MNNKLIFAWLILPVALSSYAEDFVFSKSMLEISGIKDAGAVNDDTTFYKEDQYSMSIYINKKFFTQHSVSIKILNKKLTPIFEKDFIRLLSLKNGGCQSSNTYPVDLQHCVPDAVVKTDFASMKVDISIPQALLIERPADYIPSSEFKTGSTMLFSNYTLNQYTSHSKGYKTLDSTYLGLNSGVNLGKWQLRQQGSLNKSQDHARWNSNRAYVQRAIPAIRSQLMMGQLSSAGEAFNPMSFNGINQQTDNRMLPSTVTSYAPVVHGNARSNARVEVYQQKNKIYETTVPAGNFKITTLNPAAYGGDLRVVVTESDGSRSEYTVPFSQLPGSVRPGQIDYAFSAGRLRDYSKNNQFAEFTGKYGVNNAITANGGLRIAKQYHAVAAGAIYNNHLGAFGAKSTRSEAEIRHQGKTQGWMIDANYSKTITLTNTTVSFAGYHYSTKGYRELQDVVALNSQKQVISSYEGGTYMQKNRLQATVSQPLGKFGNFYVSGSTQNYYDGRSKESAFQMGYSKTLPYNITMNLNVSREYQTRVPREQSLRPGHDTRHEYKQYIKQTQFGINLSIPLGAGPYANTLTTSYNGGNHNDNYQTSLSGIAGEYRDIQWGVNYNHTVQDAYNSFGTNVSTVFPKATINATAAKSNDSWQVSGSVNGAVAVHSGGVTLGNTLSDTFGLVEAKGATGARLLNYRSVTIDANGYALIPSLMPYRRNSISLDTPEGNSNVDILDSERQVVPYAGAAIKIRFQTQTGVPVMLQITRPDGSYLPLGAEIRDTRSGNKGSSFAMVGQAGNTYLRLDNQQHQLVASWDNRTCQLDYQLPKVAAGQSLVFSKALCR